MLASRRRRYIKIETRYIKIETRYIRIEDESDEKKEDGKRRTGSQDSRLRLAFLACRRPCCCCCVSCAIYILAGSS
jgi:hypothetical protein